MPSAPSVSLTSVSVQKSAFTSDCISIASSYLQAETDDYFFFQYDDDVYVLLVGDIDFINGSVTSESCQAVVIWRSGTSHTHHTTQNYSGTFGGSFMGFQNSGTLNGNNSGTVDFVTEDITYSYFFAESTVTNVSVINSGNYLIYSSFPNSPHLIEGVQNYAVAAFVLAAGVIAFKLADRLFRRIY